MGKGRKAEARVKAKETKAGAKNSDLNFSDASVQLFHPSHEGDQASTTVILTVGEERLAFNCVEGFQRMCSECNVRRCLGVFLEHTALGQGHLSLYKSFLLSVWLCFCRPRRPG